MAVLTHPAVNLDIELLQGEAVGRVLQDREFVLRWSELFQQCPWSTAYQAADYAMAWFRCYSELYEPLLIRKVSADGGLAGLLALGVSKQNGELVPVGAPHAEYTAWLSDPQASECFVEDALDLLSTRYPAASLTLRYLAPGAPVDWARFGSRWASRCIVLEAERPAMELNVESIRKSLRKRNNRNRLSRLRRSGQLEFRRLTDVDALARMLDAIIPQHDLRRVALYGIQPLGIDAQTQAFYLELLRSGRLHATVSTIDNHIVAAMIGICDRETVHLDLLCHSPMFAAQSPGKLHLLTLAEHLVTEGFKYIDLTPGDLLWKDRSATNYDSIHEVIVAFSRRGLLRTQAQVLVKHHTKRIVKPFLSWLRLEPRVVKSKVRQLTDEGLRGLVGKAIRTIFGLLGGTDELKVCQFDCIKNVNTDNDLAIKMDSLEDLFLLKENSVGLNRAFLRRAYERLCAGEHVFTHTQEGRLLGLCWVKATEAHFEKNDADSSPCYVLHDPYYHALADRKRLCISFVRSIARAFGSQFPDREFKLCARHSDHELTAALDELRREERPDTKIAGLRMLTDSMMTCSDVIELGSSF